MSTRLSFFWSMLANLVVTGLNAPLAIINFHSGDIQRAAIGVGLCIVCGALAIHAGATNIVFRLMEQREQ